MFKKSTIVFVALLVVFGFAFSTAAQDWEIVKRFDFNDNLNQMFVVSQDHGYILAGQSVWEFNGHLPVWSQKSDLPTRMDLINRAKELSYSTNRMIAWEDTVVVVGSEGSIFYSNDAGSNWIDISDTTYLGVTFEWVHGPDANHFWICGGTSAPKPKKGYIIKVESLTSPILTRQDTDDMDYKLSHIYFTDLLHGHTATGGNRGDYFRTVDGGKTWTKIAGNFKGGTSGQIYDLVYVSQEVGYAAGYDGYVYKTSDGGASVWEQIETPEYQVSSSSFLPALYVLNEQEFWIGGKEGRMYYSNDGGKTFSSYQIPSGNNFDSFWFRNANEGIVMSSTQIFHAHLGGDKNWEPITNWVGDSWRGIAVVGEDKLCLITADGMYSYGSIADLPLPRVAIPDNYQDLNSALFINNKGFLMGYKTVMMTTDDGATWTEVVNANSGLGRYVWDMAFIDENTGYFGDSGGTLWKTMDGGFHWAEDTTIGKNLKRIIFPNSQTGYVLDFMEEKILKTTDGGSTWTPYAVTTRRSYLYDMEMVDDTTLVIAGYDASNTKKFLGYILRSTDSGETWEEVFRDSLFYDSFNLFSVQFHDSIGYATGNNGVILKSENRGKSWSEDINPLSGQNLWLYDGKFLPNGNFYTGGTMGYVLRKVIIESVHPTTTDVPKNFELYQNYPNPFNPVTKIVYDLPAKSKVTLSIYNALGQNVATLITGNQKAGRHQVTWDASGVPSGVYFCRLKAKEFTAAQKMLLLR